MSEHPFTRRGLLALPALAAAQPSGYVDWSWQAWRDIARETRPGVTSAQSGQPLLSNLVGVPRQTLRAVLDVFLGTPPAAPPPLEARTGDEIRLDRGIVRRSVRFQTEPGEFVPAWLLHPPLTVRPLPALLCPHQTTQEGRNEPAGIRGNPRLAIALALARRGYVTLTWDAACFGERHNPASGHYGDAIPFYRTHPRWSMMAKMAWDASRAVDYLRQLDFVDPARIGSIGHSHGGYTTLFAMALDPRIAAGVSSCGFDTFRHDGNPYRWSHATALVPRLGFYCTSPYLNLRNYAGVPDSETIRIPFDLHWLLGLIAPRPVLLAASDDDNIFPNAGWSTRQAEARLQPVYEQAGAAGRFETFYFRGGHGFPPASEERAFAFIDRWLRR